MVKYHYRVKLTLMSCVLETKLAAVPALRIIVLRCMVGTIFLQSSINFNARQKLFIKDSTTFYRFSLVYCCCWKDFVYRYSNEVKASSKYFEALILNKKISEILHQSNIFLNRHNMYMSLMISRQMGNIIFPL